MRRPILLISSLIAFATSLSRPCRLRLAREAKCQFNENLRVLLSQRQKYRLSNAFKHLVEIGRCVPILRKGIFRTMLYRVNNRARRDKVVVNLSSLSRNNVTQLRYTYTRFFHIAIG